MPVIGTRRFGIVSGPGEMLPGAAHAKSFGIDPATGQPARRVRTWKLDSVVIVRNRHRSGNRMSRTVARTAALRVFSRARVTYLPAPRKSNGREVLLQTVSAEPSPLRGTGAPQGRR